MKIFKNCKTYDKQGFEQSRGGTIVFDRGTVTINSTTHQRNDLAVDFESGEITSDHGWTASFNPPASLLTIHVYSNADNSKLDSYSGLDNDDCETWFEREWGSNDTHASYK